MRTAKITLAGSEYLIAFSAQSQMNIEALKRQPGFSVQTHGAELAFSTLYECLRAGYRYAKLTGMQTPEPPAREILADMIDESDIIDNMELINSVVTGERAVEARPPKKAEAGPSER